MLPFWKILKTAVRARQNPNDGKYKNLSPITAPIGIIFEKGIRAMNIHIAPNANSLFFLIEKITINKIISRIINENITPKSILLEKLKSL